MSDHTPWVLLVLVVVVVVLRIILVGGVGTRAPNTSPSYAGRYASLRHRRHVHAHVVVVYGRTRRRGRGMLTERLGLPRNVVVFAQGQGVPAHVVVLLRPVKSAVGGRRWVDHVQVVGHAQGLVVGMGVVGHACSASQVRSFGAVLRVAVVGRGLGVGHGMVASPICPAFPDQAHY